MRLKEIKKNKIKYKELYALVERIRLQTFAWAGQVNEWIDDQWSYIATTVVSIIAVVVVVIFPFENFPYIHREIIFSMIHIRHIQTVSLFSLLCLYICMSYRLIFRMIYTVFNLDYKIVCKLYISEMSLHF